MDGDEDDNFSDFQFSVFPADVAKIEIQQDRIKEIKEETAEHQQGDEKIPLDSVMVKINRFSAEKGPKQIAEKNQGNCQKGAKIEFRIKVHFPQSQSLLCLIIS